MVQVPEGITFRWRMVASLEPCLKVPVKSHLRCGPSCSDLQEPQGPRGHQRRSRSQLCFQKLGQHMVAWLGTAHLAPPTSWGSSSVAVWNRIRSGKQALGSIYIYCTLLFRQLILPYQSRGTCDHATKQFGQQS